LEGQLTKLTGHPHCCNCANVRDTKGGWACVAEMWGGALIMPESVSMSWDWGVWAGDVFVGFVKEYGCQSYAPAEYHRLELTVDEKEWAIRVVELAEEAVRVDTAYEVDPLLWDRYNLLDLEVLRLSEKLCEEGRE
jgi:hypothetical protein